MIKHKNTYFILTLFCILSVLSFSSMGQTKSTDVKTINGKKYYIHKVEKGQSLYAIAKTYGMDVNSILAENDDAIDGLKNGQELKIPFECLLPKQTSSSIDTNKYVYHKIVKGETVYGITKKYGIDEKKLNSLNPNLIGGLKEGEYVIVGEKKKSSAVTSSTQAPITNDTYTVLQGETLYGISKKLNVSQDDLLKWNPELKDGVKQGQVLKIVSTKKAINPVVTQSTAVIAPTLSSDKLKDQVIEEKSKKGIYNIGLLLPFKLMESEGIVIEDLMKSKSSFPQTQSLALDFYFGFKKAVDSLVAKDFEINIHLFDVDEKDSAKVENICKSTEFKTLDAVFGPLYAGVFKQVANKAKVLNIPVVSPLTQQNKILYNNALTSKVNPSQFTLIEGLADYCSDSLLTSSNIIIVNTTAKDQQYIKTFKSRYNSNLVKHNKTLKDTITEVKGISGVKNAFVPNKKNVIVLLTNNQVYLQDFITQLYMFSDKKDVVLMGFNSVSNIENLDQEYLNALQFHFASANHISYNDTTIRYLAKQYQEVYTTDPSEFYFQGFDIGMYYLSNLKTTGPDLFLNLDKYYSDAVSTGFKFYRPDNETGFENRAVYIYKYSNYQLQQLGWK